MLIEYVVPLSLIFACLQGACNIKEIDFVVVMPGKPKSAAAPKPAAAPTPVAAPVVTAPTVTAAAAPVAGMLR